MSALGVPATPTVALVGVGGFGKHHLVNLHRLATAGRLRLVALVSGGGIGRLRTEVPSDVAALAASVPVHPSLDDYLATVPEPATVVVISTPIHTHTELASKALRAGAHVLLEKPPTPGMAGFEELLTVVAETGRLVQVGFQSFGSQALPRLAEIISSGGIGRLRGVGAIGTWARPVSYFGRSAWSGKRVLDGIPVVDGVVTNPLAHAVATALKVAGATRVDDVQTVGVDLYRANAIDCDDTSAVTVTTSTGVPLALGLTLTAAEQSAPRVIAYGTTGTATLYYTEDLLERADGGRVSSERFERTDLTENLLDHLADPAVPLLCPLADTGAFTAVVEAVRAAPEPRRIPKQYIDLQERDGDTWTVVTGVEDWCRRVSDESATFAELGAPWCAPRHATIAEIIIGGRRVARYLDGAGAPRMDGPRPHFHPLATLAGITVTEDSPADHSWHAGLGWGVQDVARDGEPGNNLWGGRTYVRGRGYQWLDDHGRIVHTGWTDEPAGATETLQWRDREDQVLLHETRRLGWAGLDDRAWALRFVTELSTPGSRPVSFGSPGSNGRTDGGYGGFFWRLPEARAVEVRTPLASGETRVHGTTGDWLAWTATDPASGARYTVAISGDDPASLADPYVVRVSDYPGIGSAIAWEARTQVTPGTGLRRSFTAIVADGQLNDVEVAGYLARARSQWH